MPSIVGSLYTARRGASDVGRLTTGSRRYRRTKPIVRPDMGGIPKMKIRG